VSADPTRVPGIEALLLEQRTFPPDPAFAAPANATVSLRRLLRDIAEGRTLGDTSTLADAAVVDTIREHSGRAED
jgi:hypothetical protein